jgi:hypothetical protein
VCWNLTVHVSNCYLVISRDICLITPLRRPPIPSHLPPLVTYLLRTYHGPDDLYFVYLVLWTFIVYQSDAAYSTSSSARDHRLKSYEPGPPLVTSTSQPTNRFFHRLNLWIYHIICYQSATSIKTHPPPGGASEVARHQPSWHQSIQQYRLAAIHGTN